MTNFPEAIINAFAHALGHDIFITRGASARTDGTSFDYLPRVGFSRTSDGVEVWGLGVHAVVSRLRVHPQV